MHATAPESHMPALRAALYVFAAFTRAVIICAMAAYCCHARYVAPRIRVIAYDIHIRFSQYVATFDYAAAFVRCAFVFHTLLTWFAFRFHIMLYI